MPEEVQVEVEAKRMGWVPKEDFRGNKDKWVDAATFVDRGKNMIPLLKENIERMSTKYGAIENELKETKKTISEFVDYSKKSEERAYKRAKSEYDQEVTKLKGKMKVAVKAGDTETYEALDEVISKMEPPEKPEVKVEFDKKPDPVKDASVETPEMKVWKGENDWFTKDVRMTKYAISIENDVVAENPGKTQAEILKLIADEVKVRFPEKFKNPNREKGNSVDTGDSDGRRTTGKHSFDDLPKDAKDQYAKFKKEFKDRANKDYTKEEYLKDYDWEE